MVYVFLAEGFELVEALAPVDILRRAGAEVQLVGVEGREVAASNGVTVRADCTAQEISRENLVGMVLPGGLPGTLNLEKSPIVQETLDYCVKEGKLIGAICAAPSILAHKGLLKGREATAFPKFQPDLTEGGRVPQQGVCLPGRAVYHRAGHGCFYGIRPCAGSSPGFPGKGGGDKSLHPEALTYGPSGGKSSPAPGAFGKAGGPAG